MRSIPTLLSLFVVLLSPRFAAAQCAVGEVEVFIEVTTDLWGYETYWQLVPGGNACGTGTIFEGGNPTMDCNSAGLQLQDPSGYDDTTLYVEGPWCLTEGAPYDIHSLDDYGDGQAAFEVIVDGQGAEQFQQAGATNLFTFIAQAPLTLDMAVTGLTTSLFSHEGVPVTVVGTIKNLGVDAVVSFDLHYSLDGGAPVSASLSGLSLVQFEIYEFEHPDPWIATTAGPHALTVWADNINGGPDLNPLNDVGISNLTVTPAIPNIIDQYIWGSPLVEAIANSNQDLLVPRDLDFHPDPTRNELWVINKDTEPSGSSTVKFTAPGEVGMSWLWQEDPNNWHFMSLATGIAFGDNGNFSTCPGVFDANHNGGTPFTGISLWSSDPAIYAQPIFGGLGSHLDMLHVTPNAQGIAHEQWNRYWVVDGFNGDVVMHDFKADHGPGNDYHGNAVIRRYDEDQIIRDPLDHVVSHCAFDKSTGWLYVVDFGGQRVFRIDTQTGVVSGPGDYGPWESYAEYSMVTGYTQEVLVTTGLVQPAGIEVIGDRMLVSDHSNGDIVIYDISSGATEIGRIHTLLPGIMGITIGPDGRIWYVNATTHELGRITPDANVGLPEAAQVQWSMVPNPADAQVWLTGGEPGEAMPVIISDATGREVVRSIVREARQGLEVGDLSNGAYTVRVGGQTRRVVIRR